MMNNRISLIVALLLVLIASVAPCSAQQSITVEIVNDSLVQPPDEIYLLLTGKQSDVSGITVNVPTKLSELTDNQFELTKISAGRITFSFIDSVQANQNPLDPSARFDKVELTYPGAANLTSVDFFGIPFKLETLDNSKSVLQTLTFYTSKNTLVPKLQKLASDALVETKAVGGSFARILSPTIKPASYPNMQKYVSSVVNQPLKIAGTYVGPVGPSPNTFNYSGTFEMGSTVDMDSTIRLEGTLTDGVAEDLTIKGSTLASAIYTNNEPYNVTGAKNPRHVDDNDVYSAIYRDLVAGFSFGYIDGKYGSDSSSWYGTTPFNPPYACARSSNDGYFNQYASVIAANSDAYGFPFADLLALVQVGLNPPGTLNTVATLRITILPDDMLDAPIIQSTSSTEETIDVSWNPTPDATDYTVQVSPPSPAKTFPPGTSTSATINNLKPGTPYTVSVVASDGTSSSEAIPTVISTKGSVSPVTGTVMWNFIPNFTGTFPDGHKITFNGVSKALPTTSNPSIQFNGIQGMPGEQNGYVFKWTNEKDDLVFSSVLYVKLASSPTTGLGDIDQDLTATFMAANQHTPTYSETFNLFLSIAPNSQRTICTSGSLGSFPMKPDSSETVRAGQTSSDGQQNDDGQRDFASTETIDDGIKATQPTKLPGANRLRWWTPIQAFGSAGVVSVDVKPGFLLKPSVYALNPASIVPIQFFTLF